ncbi:MAG TPA: MBL fold metallo-hydrolase, partial [Bacillales bacterium]|nr:MBL fold metallo-hydrolase [Bacillales bacterium]
MFQELRIQPIRIDLPFRLDHVNCFLAEGEDGWKLLDTGLHDERTMAVWNEILEGKELSDLLISHYHPDHFGCAG